MNLSTFIFSAIASTSAVAPAGVQPPSKQIEYANWHDRVMQGMHQVERAVARQAVATYLSTGVLPVYTDIGASLNPTLVPTYGFMPSNYRTMHWHVKVADLGSETGVVICAHTPAAQGEAESRAFADSFNQLPAGRAWLSDVCGSPGTPLTGVDGVTLNFSIPQSLIQAYVRSALHLPVPSEASTAPAPATSTMPGASATTPAQAGSTGAPGQALSDTVLQAGRGKKADWVIVAKPGRPTR